MKKEKEGKCEYISLDIFNICVEFYISEIILTAQVIEILNLVRVAFLRCRNGTHITQFSSGSGRILSSSFFVLWKDQPRTSIEGHTLIAMPDISGEVFQK